QRLFTPGDKTDSTGFYRIVIPPGNYRIRFDAPESTRYRGVQLDSVTIQNDTSLNAFLPTGLAVSGRVVNNSGAGIFNVSLDFEDKVTGKEILVSNKRTNLSGHYWVAVPPGSYQVQFKPPSTSHLRGREFDSIAVLQDLMTLNVQLDSGLVVRGTITDSANQPISNVSMDIFDYQTRQKIFVAHNRSDTAGNYRIVVPPGGLRFRFNSPASSRFRGLQLDTVSVSKDTTVNITLLTGLVLSGGVVDSVGRGIKGVSLELEETTTGQEVFVSNSRSDTVGFFRTVAPAGLFNLLFSPPKGQRWVAVENDSFQISTDTTVQQVLVEGILVTARITDSSARPLQGVDLDVIQGQTGKKVFTPHDNTDSAGVVQAALLPDRYTFAFNLFTGTSFDSLVISNVLIARDTTLNGVLRVASFIVTGKVQDSIGRGIPNVILGFEEAATSNKVPVLNNRTDAAGAFRITVFANTYNITSVPPPQSGFDSVVLLGVLIRKDTNLVVVLTGRPAQPPPDATRILDARPNPLRPGSDGQMKFPIDLNSVSGNWKVSLTIFSPAGEIVYRNRTELPGGTQQVLEWDGSNEDGQPVASGIYFCKIVVEKPGDSKRIEKALKVAVIR
ncbi:MAG: FlgD immunoglobulin-like domain containing protein, partial [Limisphaerales bacterium]